RRRRDGPRRAGEPVDDFSQKIGAVEGSRELALPIAAAGGSVGPAQPRLDGPGPGRVAVHHDGVWTARLPRRHAPLRPGRPPLSAVLAAGGPAGTVANVGHAARHL